MRFRLIVAFALVMGACGGSGSSTEPDPDPVDSSPIETADAGAFEICPDAVIAVPERLPTGEVQELPNHGRDHEVCADYDRTPPASGPHFPGWQNCGIYAQPIQNQTAVHSLEHGAVWVAYQPDLDAAVLQTITDQLKSEPFALVAPYPGLQNPIVLTAWTRQLAVDDWSDPAVGDFLDTYLGRYSPVAPEAGASCGQAIGSAPGNPNLHYQEVFEQVS